MKPPALPGVISLITGVFIGKFEWRPNQVPSRILHLKKVLDLKVTEIPPSDSLKHEPGHADPPKPE